MTNHTTKVTLATMSLVELARVANSSMLDIQNWLKRLSFTTRFSETQQGRAQKFTRDNCIEISLINRLVQAGVSPGAAAERVRLLFKDWGRREVLGWVLFTTDKRFEKKVLCLDEPLSAELMDKLDKAGCYLVLNVAQLVDRIDAHFDDQEQKGAA